MVLYSAGHNSSFMLCKHTCIKKDAVKFLKVSADTVLPVLLEVFVVCALLLCNYKDIRYWSTLEHRVKMSDSPKLSKGAGILFFEESSFHMNRFSSKKPLLYDF